MALSTPGSEVTFVSTKVIDGRPRFRVVALRPREESLPRQLPSARRVARAAEALLFAADQGPRAYSTPSRGRHPAKALYVFPKEALCAEDGHYAPGRRHRPVARREGRACRPHRVSRHECDGPRSARWEQKKRNISEIT